MLVRLPSALLEAFFSERSCSWSITCPQTKRSEATCCHLANIPGVTMSCRRGMPSLTGLTKYTSFVSLTMGSQLLMDGNWNKKKLSFCGQTWRQSCSSRHC